MACTSWEMAFLESKGTSHGLGHFWAFGMPEEADIVSTAPAGLASLAAAISRWSGNGGMKPTENTSHRNFKA